MQYSINRRHFLRTSGAVLALPWLESLAGAAEPTPPRRMVSVCTAFGLYGPSLFPSTAGRDYSPSEYLKILAELRGDYTIFSGISHPDIGGDHASEACFLTAAKQPRRPGFRNTVSMDFLAARHVAGATRIPLLSLSTDDAGGLTHSQSGAPIRADWSPSKLYARMFLAGKATEVEAELQRLKNGQSILDRMQDRFDALTPRLSHRDQQQLADYTEAVREMEKQLHAGEQWVHRPKPTVDEPPPQDNPDKSDFIGRSKLMFQLIRLALQTDSTRVCSLFIRGMDLTPPIEGVKENHHGLSHHGRNPAKLAELKLVEQAEMQAFREFLVDLRQTSEGAGSLLDHTQVLIGSNLGDASGHGTTNLPIILAGGGWKHGQHIAGDTKNNTPLCNLFVSMMQRFGMEIDAFGSSSGTMNGLG
ncbi:MAG: DUF1552 domain-containing protein [Pirellulales bacterium]